MIQPYIDDPKVKQYCREQIAPAYHEAGRELDDDYPVWPSRAVYDHGVGNLSWEASCAKHLRECREALGLPVIVPPPSPVTDTWPRFGASYYTSATDPRVNVPEFAARLRDAGCTHTRVWLLDAWALGASAGTGCYQGWVPWLAGTDGRYDLWNVSSAYLARLVGYVATMNAAGILPELSGLELYSWSDRKQGALWVPDARQGPFRKNRQGIYYADDTAFERIAQPSGEDAFLGHFYAKVVQALANLSYAVETGNEMPEKPLHLRLCNAWRTAGFAGSIATNRQDDTPGQYQNMRIGQDYDRIAYHGKRDMGYLTEDFPDEPVYRTFQAFYDSNTTGNGTYEPWRITLSSDGCRKSTDVNDAYDYDALGEVFTDGLARGFSVEHQSCMKLRGFTENRIDLNDLETDWLRSLRG